jgi:hypothetical protein
MIAAQASAKEVAARYGHRLRRFAYYPPYNVIRVADCSRCGMAAAFNIEQPQASLEVRGLVNPCQPRPRA